MFIHRTPFFLPWLYPNLVWRIPTKQKELFLTLDDGPVPGPTEFALDVLKEHKANATFFCIGDNVQKHPDVFKRILHEGHAVGNHTFNHLNGWHTPKSEYVKNAFLCDAAMDLPHSGNEMKNVILFRPPYGRITRSQIKALSAYKIIMWDVLSFDYTESITPEACLKNSIKATRPGSVIVFHDSLKAEKNMRYALPRFIAHFTDRGYSFNVIPQ
ncbi:MAG: polysaccharide deacetylase family protein [Cyclobacteriaceae bacterium]|nr:polysaccharide deacetylase family protein [Cyclobacteriaceae bacterium]UYN88131.1 MAG: polysaccharide deacetylase family protein [Cyclobacteriaceae bacterium]